MKKALLLVFFCVNFGLSQTIHSILVNSTNVVSIQQAKDEFWQYHLLATTTWSAFQNNTFIQSNYGYTWPNQMLVWDQYGTSDGEGSQQDAYTREMHVYFWVTYAHTMLKRIRRGEVLIYPLSKK